MEPGLRPQTRRSPAGSEPGSTHSKAYQLMSDRGGCVGWGAHGGEPCGRAPSRTRTGCPPEEGHRKPSRKNQPELPKRQTHFNHSRQAGQGRSQVRSEDIAPAFTARGQVLLPAPITEP